MIYWSDKPFARVIILFIAGIVLAGVIPVHSKWIYFGVLLFFSLFQLSRKLTGVNREYYTGFLLIIFIITLGYARTISLLPEMTTGLYSNHVHVKHVFIDGEIKSIPKKTSRYSTTVDIKAIGSHVDSMKRCNGKVMIYFQEADSIVEQYIPGDQILLNGYMTAMRASRNPNAFDFNDYLKTKYIYHRVDVDANAHFATGINHSNYLERLANSIRSHSLRTFDKYLEDKNHNSLTSAMVLGFRNTIDPELYNSYTKTGAVHVLAVSGLHVGILCTILLFFLDKILGRTNRDKFSKLLILTFCCSVYVIITGASAAVLRASVMVIIYFIGKYWANHVNTYNVVSLSGFLLLVYDPNMLYQASFQFSFMALLSIVYFFNRIYRLIYIENKYLNYMWQLVALSIAAQILVAPLTIYYFHRFPTYFWLSGIVAVPAAYVVLVIGISMVIIEYIFPVINEYTSVALEWFFELFIGSIRWIEKLPLSTIENIWLYNHEIVLLYVSILSLMAALSWKNVNYIILGLIAFLSYTISRNHNIKTSLKQSKITLYDNYKGYIIDIISGPECYSIVSDKVSDRTLEFVAKNNRIKHRLNEIHALGLHDSLNIHGILKKGSLLQIKDESILIIDSNYVEIDTSVNVDLAIITSHKMRDIKRIHNYINAKEWIITQNEKYYFVFKWKDWCENANKDCTILQEHGAYTYNIN